MAQPNMFGVTEFDQDPETAAELMRLKRQQQIADAMYGQSQQPLQGGMVGQVYVPPSITQGLAKLFQGYSAGRQSSDVQEGYKKLATERRAMEDSERSRVMEALIGRPEQPMGPPTPTGEMGVREAAPAGSKEQVMQALASSRLPSYRDAGLKAMIAERTAKAESPWAKVDPKDYTPESLAAFALSKNPADLRAIARPAGKMGTEDVHIGGGKWQSFKVGGDGQVDLQSPIGKPFDKRPTASSVEVNQKVEQKTGESMAKEIGGMLKDSKIAVTGAIKMNDAADRILKAIETGNVTAGPLSSKIQTMRQFFDRSGGDSNDKVRQTRQVIRALAESSVEARKELQGQGQVTENEALAVQKAMSGDIDSLTVGELQDIANLNKKAATIRAQGHQAMLDEASRGEGTKGLVNYYKVPGMEMLLQPAQVPKKVASDADYAALPSGAIFIDPQGNQRRKP